MAFWLVKSEPSVWSWAQMEKAKKTAWDGVRNHQAGNNMKAMKKGDRVFFYHSGEGREIVGIAQVSKTHHPDPSDKTGKFGMVELEAVKPLKTPVTLAQIKAHPQLKTMSLARQSRLSVSPVSAGEWKTVCALGGV